MQNHALIFPTARNSCVGVSSIGWETCLPKTSLFVQSTFKKGPRRGLGRTLHSAIAMKKSLMEDGEVCVTVYMYIFIHDSRLYQMLVYLSLVPAAVFVKSLRSYRAGRHQPVPTCLHTRAARRGHHFIVNLRNTELTPLFYTHLP